MLNMEEISNIKYLREVKKLSYKQISEITGFDWRTVKKWANSKEYPVYKRKKNSAPVKEKVIKYVKTWIDEDTRLIEQGKIKNIRSAAKMHEDLNNMGIECSVRSIQKYVNDIKPQEVFIEQEYFPAEDMQVDWGELYLDFEENIRCKVYIFVATLPYSNSRFISAYMNCNRQSFFDGHIRAFDFFGGVPKRIRYDNLRSAVKKVLKGSSRIEQDKMIHFKTFFHFETNYCNVAKGNEKGNVENAVGYAKRRFLSDNKIFKSITSLNKHLFDKCRDELNKTHYRKGKTIKELLSEEITQLKALPKEKYDNSIHCLCKVRNTLTIQFDSVRYSVPAKYSGKSLSLIADIKTINIYDAEKIVARYKRFHKPFRKEVYDFRHYLPVLIKKSRALTNAKCIIQSNFPPIFRQYLDRLNSRMENGNREMVRILLLHKQYKMKDIFFAMEWCYEHKSFSFDAMKITLKELTSDKPKIEKVNKRYSEIKDIPLNIEKYDKLIGV